MSWSVIVLARARDDVHAHGAALKAATVLDLKEQLVDVEAFCGSLAGLAAMASHHLAHELVNALRQRRASPTLTEHPAECDALLLRREGVQRLAADENALLRRALNTHVRA
jgi:hypothetical protein